MYLCLCSLKVPRSALGLCQVEKERMWIASEQAMVEREKALLEAEQEGRAQAVAVAQRDLRDLSMASSKSA